MVNPKIGKKIEFKIFVKKNKSFKFLIIFYLLIKVKLMNILILLILFD